MHRPPVRRPTPLLSAFGGDDEDEKPRALKKLSYTAEELAAGQVCDAHSTVIPGLDPDLNRITP